MWCKSGARECDGCMRCRPEPRAVGRCAGCGDGIVEGEEYYKFGDDVVHDDCLREWAEKFRAVQTEEAV